MAKLKHTFRTDILFKLLFTRHQGLLRKLVADLLGIARDSISRFEITNPEIPPEVLESKFCRLDVNMVVDGRLVNLEIQVRDEGDFPERALYHWARMYSASLQSGGDYKELPRAVVISIVDFPLFGCAEFHSEFAAIEARRGERLSDRMSLHFFELPKLPKEASAGDAPQMWLSLFNARTEKDLKKILETEVPEMEEAITAYRQITATPEFRELERLREKAAHNEAAALRHARMEGEMRAHETWKGVLAGKDAEIERLRAELKAKSGN